MGVAVCEPAPQGQGVEWLAAAATHGGVDVAHGLRVAPDVDLVVVVLRRLAVHRVVEVHALGVPAPPVPPEQKGAGAQQGEH